MAPRPALRLPRAVFWLPRAVFRLVSPVVWLFAAVEPLPTAAVAWLPAAVASLLMAGTGCAAGGASQGPREALREYAMALHERRLADAYALLSREARARVSFADFSRMVTENAREIEDISA